MTTRQVRGQIVDCDRCSFGPATTAVQTRIYALENRYYELDLCAKHADMFDRDLGGWTRLSAEIDNPYAGAVTAPTYFNQERKDEVRRLRVLKEVEEAKLCAARRAEELRVEGERLAYASIPGARRWRLTNHARERLEERGFAIREVLETASAPEHTYDQVWRGPNTKCYVRGACRIVVDCDSYAIITVIGRDEEMETGPKPAHNERKAL